MRFFDLRGQFFVGAGEIGGISLIVWDFAEIGAGVGEGAVARHVRKNGEGGLCGRIGWL
jgi:hypothetical protein